MKARTHRLDLARRVARGFSLIELMVGITIALIVTLAIFSVLTVSESRKRSTTAINDINQSGAYSAYVLDRAIRSAGSGVSNQQYTLQLGADLEGCALDVTRGGAAVAPRASAYPAPFAAITQTPVLAPVIIDPGTGTASDVITVMSGSAGKSEAGARVIGPSVTGVGLVNTFGFNAGDLVLFGHNATDGACIVSQVATTFVPQVPAPTLPATTLPEQSLPLGGTYVSGASTLNLAGNLALSLGNATTNPPQFKMYGVDANRQLVSYDLLNIDNTAASQPVAEGVLEMRAVYGVDTDDNNAIDAWVAPTGVWAPATLRNGTAASSVNLRRIVAVHVALVMRSALIEKEDVQATTTFTLYGSLRPTGLATRQVSYTAAGDQRYRYRVIETTIPLRNNLL